MTIKPMNRSLILSDRVYRFLLKTYPTGFRTEYGAEMAQVFRDSCRDEFTRSGSGALLGLWLFTLLDWAKTAADQHIQEAFNMSGREWMVRIGAIASVVGGLLGVILLLQGPNSYGNYTWHGPWAPVAPFLFAVGFGGGIALFAGQLGHIARTGMILMVVGLLLHSIGYAFGDSLWALGFIGPVMVVPIGAIVLATTILRHPSLPTWWRYFPILIFAIAIVEFGIEAFEGFNGNSTPDRGLQAVEALYSVAWIGLGIGLWRGIGDRVDGSPMAA